MTWKTNISFCYMYNENLIKEVLQVIIAGVITGIITAVAVWFISTEYHKKVANTKIGNAEEQARGIIDEAVKNAEE